MTVYLELRIAPRDPAITMYRKVQRFLRPTHLNQLPGFSAQRPEKRAKQICKFVEVMYRAVMNLLFEG